MGIFDNIHIHPDVELDGFPDDWERNWWQTKDLNPSLDEYMIRPIDGDNWAISSNQNSALFRRHPPIKRWTTFNEGFLCENPEEIKIDADADHWRNIRYSGELEMVKLDKEVVLEIDRSVVIQVIRVSERDVQISEEKEE